MKLDVKPSERWLLMGTTGSGKTEFSKFMLRNVSMKMPVVIIDPKPGWLGDDPVWETDKRNPGTVDKPWLVKDYNPKLWVQVIQPLIYDARLEKSLHAILKRKYVYTHFDDNIGLCDANTVPMGIRRVWQTGRSLKVGASDASQTFERIPAIFKSQAENFVVFMMGQMNIEKYKEVANLVQVEVEEVKELGKYEYIYFKRGEMERGLWMPPLELDKARKAA